MALSDECRENITRWRKHLESIEAEVLDLHQQQRWFHRLHEMMAINPELKAMQKPFIGDIISWYATHASMGVRRLVDKMGDVLSLRRLLDDLVKHSACLTRDNLFQYYRGAAPTFTADVHESMVASMWRPFAAPDDTLNLSVIEDDISNLEAAAAKIRHFATHTMAHTTEKGKAITDAPTFPELEEVILILDAMITRYNHFIAGRTYMSGTNEPVELFDWRREFQIAWLPKND